MRLEKKGFNIVMHIHDEVVIESDSSSIEEINEIVQELANGHQDLFSMRMDLKVNFIKKTNGGLFMFYVKEKINDVMEVSIEINDENVFCTCPKVRKRSSSRFG